MHDDMKIENPISRSISLPGGGVLEVDATPEFLEVVRQHFELSNVDDVRNDHIRMYIYGACKGAIDKAEKEATC